VLNIAISTTLISYIVIFPSVWLLRRRFPQVHRPFHVPGGSVGLLLCSALITFWVLLGSWTAVFPGTIDRLLGLDYSFADSWGVSQATFEAFTLGTLAVIVVVSILGYAAGARVRATEVPLDLGPSDPLPAPAG
jgi:amino acid transporter